MKKDEKNQTFPLFNFSHLEINYDSYQTFEEIFKCLVGAFGKKGDLAAAMDISPSNLSQRLGFDNDLAFNVRHIQALLDQDPSAYDHLIGWLEYQKKKKSKSAIEKKADLLDKLAPLMREYAELCKSK